MRRIFWGIIFLLFALPAMAQTTVSTTWIWDASTSEATQDPANPVKYFFYRCTADPNVTPSSCTQNDAGTAKSFTIQVPSGRYWVYVTARAYEIVVDGVPSGQLLESGKSNIPIMTVMIPPGNPGNFRIRVSP